MSKSPNKKNIPQIPLPTAALVPVVDGINSSKKEIVLHLTEQYDIIYEYAEPQNSVARLNWNELRNFLFMAVELTFKSRLNFKKSSFSKQELILISNFLNDLARAKMIPQALKRYSMAKGKFKFHHKNESKKLKFNNVVPYWKKEHDKKKKAAQAAHAAKSAPNKKPAQTAKPKKPVQSKPAQTAP